MKTKRFSRTLAILLAVMMVFTMMPSMALAAETQPTENTPTESGTPTDSTQPTESGTPTEGGGTGETQPTESEAATVNVNFTSQGEGIFLHAPQFNVPVSGNLAESYGYTDGIAPTDGVSALDVLVKAHEVMLEDAFTSETATTMLAINEHGWITKIFGEDTSNCGFAINGESAADKSKPTAKYEGYPEQYQGYLINTAPVKTGDNLEFFIYQDPSTESMAMDYYTWFADKNGNKVNNIKALVGEEIELTAKGYMIAYYGLAVDESFKSGDAINVYGDSEGLPVVKINSENGVDEVFLPEKAFDENGEVTLSFDKAGKYLITVKGDDVTNVISTLCSVEVAAWEGKGTAEEPYIIKDQAGLVSLKEMCNVDKNSFKDVFFKITEDIELPADWTPIGISPKQPFSGNIDGKDANGNIHTITVPEGGKTLIGAPVEATLSNLNIYGKLINGNGVVDIYTTGVSSKTAITIDNVTLKSGTQTLRSGFVGGYASGSYTVVIKNSKVEENVVIGYDGLQSNIGSFGGDFNGTIENCVSHATVKGVKFVGGICGTKGQSMGKFEIRDCIFAGNIEATGDYIGGILGSGYGGHPRWGFAPNAPWPTIQNCLASGSISGANYVGGILGAEPGVTQCWANGIGYVQNNCFTGTLSATATDANVGGVIGYLKSVDNCTIISNNYYISSCGVAKGIGKIETVDSTPEFGRNDVTVGEDPEAFSKAFTNIDAELAKKLNSGLNSSRDWTYSDGSLGFAGNRHLSKIEAIPSLNKTSKGLTISTGEELNDSKYKLALTYSDGTTETVDLSLATKVNYDLTTTGYKAASLVYNNHQYAFLINVKNAITQPTNPEPSTNITVNVTVLGDSIHGTNGQVHTYKDNNLKTWIVETPVSVPANSTVMTALSKVLNQKGFSWMNDDKPNGNGNYIQSITNSSGETLAEFSNGKDSGWLYTLNGEYPLLGVSEQKLSSGDKIVLHYSDDYNKEYASEKWVVPGAPTESKVTTTGASGSATTTTPTEVAVTGDTAKITVKAENAAEAIKQAKANKSAEIVLDVAAADMKKATKVAAELPVATVKQIANDTQATLAVKTPQGKAVLDKEALSEIVKKAKGANVTIEIAESADKKLEVTVKSAGETIYTSAAEVEKDQLTAEQVKAKVADLKLMARSTQTAKKNVKVTLKFNKAAKATLDEFKAAGYTVKYKFYRSTKKSSKYAATLTKKTTNYTNTIGKKGTMYYYKARVQVFDKDGKMVAQTALKQCKYANRMWSKTK